MNTLKMTSGALPPPPLPTPPRTCLFFMDGAERRSSWDFFSPTFDERKRNLCVNSIVEGGGNAMISLVQNTDPANPVSFFEQGMWGGHADMARLNGLTGWARRIAAVGGALWPCFYCDNASDAPVRNAPLDVQWRALGLLVGVLWPYVPGFILGLESSEYFDCARHNELIRLLRQLAPQRYIVSHMQSIPAGGMPDIDAWFYEHPWQPQDGDRHDPDQVVDDCVNARQYNKYVWPVEYNTNVSGSVIRAQSRALLAAGFGCGGPV